jgi:hypothetical protein
MEPDAMNRTMQRTSLAAAASLLLCVGSVPAWAHDGGSSGSEQSSKGVAWGKNREAQRACKRLERDLKRSAESAGRDMKDAMLPSFDAAEALAAGDYTDADVMALQDAFDAALADALASAMADLQSMIDAKMAALKDAGASDRQLAKAAKMAGKASDRLSSRSEKIADRFGELMDELFGPSDDSMDDEGCDDGAPGDDSPPGGETPPPPPEGGDAPPPAPEGGAS